MIRNLRISSLRQNQLWRSPPGASSELLEEVVQFGDNPGALRLFQYIPAKIAKGSPLVVVLHGCEQSAEEYARGTGWVTLARELGFAVLAPEQTRSNNMNGCFNWFQEQDTKRGHGEAASIRAMVDWMTTYHSLDRRRVFITGLSAGGAMAASMLAAYPEVFCGGAIIAGLPSGAASSMADALNAMRSAPNRTSRQWGDIVRNSSSHNGHWPAISIWHGDADHIVHPSLGEASLAQWADVHGVAITAKKTSKLGRHSRREWQGSDGRVVLEMIDLKGFGHGTPVGGPTGQRYGEAGPYFLDGDIASTTHIATFWGFPVVPLVGALNPNGANDLRPVALSKSISRTIAAALKKSGLG